MPHIPEYKDVNEKISELHCLHTDKISIIYVTW